MDPHRIREELGTDVDLVRSLNDGSDLNSEITTDLLLWNVVIAFIVNVSASYAYDVIRNRVASGEPLSRKELGGLTDLISKPIQGLDPDRLDQAISSASDVLKSHGIDHAEKSVRSAIDKSTGPKAQK